MKTVTLKAVTACSFSIAIIIAACQKETSSSQHTDPVAGQNHHSVILTDEQRLDFDLFFGQDTIIHLRYCFT